jgi:hypothetical protein
LPIDPGFPPGTIWENSNEVYRDGQELRVRAEVVTDTETVEQYRQGYRCLQCHGVQDEPFPEVCKSRDVKGGSWACGYRMRDEQAARFEREYGGEGYWGPTPYEAFDDEREREAWTPKSGIWVPGTSS